MEPNTHAGKSVALKAGATKWIYVRGHKETDKLVLERCDFDPAAIGDPPTEII